MASQDHPQAYPDPDTVSPWPIAMRYGLIGGMILILYSLIGNLTGIGRPSAGMLAFSLFGLTYFGINILLLLIAIKNHRDEELGGYINIKRSLIVGTTVAVVAGVIYALFNYVYMTVIEPDMAATLVSEMETMFENWGLPEEHYEDQLAGLAESMEPMSNLTQNLIMAPVIGGVASLILGAILKKEPDWEE